MNDTIIKTVAEAERDRLIGIIVSLERKLHAAQNKSCTILAPVRESTCEPKAETRTQANGSGQIEPAPTT